MAEAGTRNWGRRHRALADDSDTDGGPHFEPLKTKQVKPAAARAEWKHHTDRG